MIGVGLFVIGFLLGILELSGVFLVSIFSWIFVILGTFAALYGAIRAGNSLGSVLMLGIIYGVGLFYAAEPHDVHVGSGFGFGLSHDLHTTIGIILIIIAVAIAGALSFRKGQA